MSERSNASMTNWTSDIRLPFEEIVADWTSRDMWWRFLSDFLQLLLNPSESPKISQNECALKSESHLV